MRQDEAIRELQRVGKALGREPGEGHPLARKEFQRNGRTSTSTLERTFGSWNAAVEAAGYLPTPKESRLSDQVLVDEFRRVLKTVGRIPSRSLFAAHSRLSPGVFEAHFGTWSAAVAACTSTQPALRSQAASERTPRRILPASQERAGTVAASQPRRRFGPLLNFRGLQHEPLNENGVVFLFGMVAKELGFFVESITPGYPDCVAKKEVKQGGRTHYESVNIEFEFRSSRFNHDPSGCDYVVCWENDWKQCPVEVIELKSRINELRNANG